MASEGQEPTVSEEVTAGGDEPETPAAPLNRAERRAQEKGKKGPAETGSLTDLRQNNVRGMSGRQSGGGMKSRLPRTGHK